MRYNDHDNRGIRWLILLCAILLVCTTRSDASPPSPEYKLLFEDTFDGDALNEQHWRHREGLREGLSMNNCMNRKENVTVSGGALRIANYQETVDGKVYNMGGGIISRHQFSYGYYETLSTPFMAGYGVHTAFWQYGGVEGQKNHIFEIDGYEVDSMGDMACHNLYVNLPLSDLGRAPWVHRAHMPVTFNPDGSYHCAYEYTPEGVTFYSQGRVVAKADWTELTAAQVVWLTALNGVGKVDDVRGETTFDYFRYYTKDYPGVNRLPNGSFEYDQGVGDLSLPMCWQQGAANGSSVLVVEGDAARDRYKLRHGQSDGAFEAATWQTLEFILNGDYEMTAMIRTSGGLETARIRVTDFGGEELTVDLPASEAWTQVALSDIPVSNQGVTIRLESKGPAGTWVEFDDVRFQKPALPGQTPTRPPFQRIVDPIWTLAKKEPISFSGDGTFYFFDRNVGLGEAITVSFVMQPQVRANTLPIARVPKTGPAGWAVQLTEQGQVVFRIGSGASSQAAVAEADYSTDRETRVTCVFDHGTAKIFIDGVLKETRTGIEFTTQDKTAPGRLGSVNSAYDAVGDVIAQTGSAEDGITGRIPRCRNYVGTLRDVHIHNRALTDDEVAALGGRR